MASFVGRQEELRRLDRVLESERKICYVEAEPRMGATTFVRRFCDKSKCIHTTFREGTERECLRSFRNAMEDFTGEPIESEDLDFAYLFQILTGIAREYDPVIVFDGTHNAPDSFVSQVRWFSEQREHMVILIGHNDRERFGMTFSDVIELEPLSFEESRLMHPKMSPMDALRTYMVVGGSPAYHSLMNKSDFESSVEKAFLGNYPKLCTECELILRRSSVPYPMCCAILSDMANSMGRPVDIAQTEGISRQLCDIYLKKLTEEDLICRLNPVGNAPRKPVYIIKNPLVAFYLMVIRGNPVLEFGDRPGYEDIEHYVDMFMELRFRDICEEYLLRHHDCVNIGRWWIKEENTFKPTMLAIVKEDEQEVCLVADCKFRGGKIDNGALKAFSARAELISEVPDKRLVMFSISGFEDKLQKKARNEGVILVGPAELLQLSGQ
ncbi:MAG: DUF234 domain-containing protein [archaeon]|nr:DUF234 domain-containing protein [archaeon]